MKKDSTGFLPSQSDWPSDLTRRYHDRQHIFVEGEHKRWAYQIETGTVCLYKTMPDGKRQIFTFGVPNDVIGLGAADVYTLSAEAIGTAHLKCLSFKTLNKLAATNAKFALTLYGAISSELEATRDLVVMLTQHGSRERVAIFLLNLARRSIGKEPYLIALPMSRSDIADFLGMKIETLSRSLAALCKTALIDVSGRSKIQIKDMEGLQRLAGLTIRPATSAQDPGDTEGFE